MEEIQAISEISLFNEIEDFSEIHGYDAIFFKVKKRKGLRNIQNINDKDSYIHYIQLYKDNKMKISVYYDGDNVLSNGYNYQYYEFYSRRKTERFCKTEKDEQLLLEEVKRIVSR